MTDNFVTAHANASPPRNWSVGLSLLGCYMVVTICSRYLLVNDELYYASLTNQMTDEQIRQMLAVNKEWIWFSYALLLALLVVKLFVIAAILAVGYYIMTTRWELRPFLRTAIIAEFVMLLPAVTKLGWFGLVQPSYNLNDLLNFGPLSLGSMVKLDATESWLRYPLQTASLFEVAYCLVLMLGAHQLAQLRWRQAARLVGFSYLPALLVWVVIVMFISVSTS